MTNNASSLQTFAPFVISVRGAKELKSFVVPPYQQSSQVVINDVADIGGLQAVIFIYSSPGCGANRRDVAGFVDVIPGQTVEANLAFNATNCGGFVGAARELTWKRNGTEIGYLLSNALYKIEAAGRATPGESWFTTNDFIDSTLAWSPVNDFVLYDVIGSGGGIFRRNLADGQPGQRIVNRTVLADPVKPAWLPDGSGFLYLFGGDIYSADANGNNRRQLTFFAAGERAEQVSPAPRRILRLRAAAGQRLNAMDHGAKQPGEHVAIDNGQQARLEPSQSGNVAGTAHQSPLSAFRQAMICGNGHLSGSSKFQ